MKRASITRLFLNSRLTLVRNRTWFAAVGFAAIALLAVPLAVTDSWGNEPLRVGMAEADITPPEGFPIAGYYHERLATGTIDPLKAKAIVFRQGDQQAAIVVCDLTGISRDLCETVRRQAHERTGIPPTAIAISGTHSHTAPDYTKHLYQYLAAKKSAPSGNSPAATTERPYAEKLIGGIVQAIETAHRQAEPVSISAGSETQGVPVSFNRRFVMKDGSVQTWRSLEDPNVVRPAGPIDPEVGVVLFQSPSGKTKGVLSNFALHLDTVGGLKWSADYPYFIEQAVRKLVGPEAISVFGTGCCGDINHVDPSRKERNKTDYIGNAIASSIESAIPKVTRLNNTDLRVRSKVVNVPLQDLSAAELERSIQLLKVIQDGGKTEFLDQVTAYRNVILSQFRDQSKAPATDKQISWGLSHAWNGIGDSLPVDVQTICIGDEVAIVFLPGEVFVDLGLAIKRASPFRTTLVIELSNAVETAYIPTRAACAGGSYEVTNSTVKPGAGEMLVEAAIGLLKK